MDALSEVLGSVRLKSSIFTRSEAGAPWGISLQAKAMVRFHYVARGGGWLSAESAPAPLALSTGALVVLPLGDAHALHDQPRRRLRSLEQMLESTEQTAGALLLRFGGTGPRTTVISGCLEFENATARLLSTLPRIIRITAEEGRAVPWLERNLQFIEAEASSNRPGAQLVLARIGEVIFVQALRAHIESVGAEQGGFLRALHDHQLGNALASMHRQPGEGWTVASLAARAGLSRSVFAARFRRLVGESPLAYLTRLRMEKAAALLGEGAALAEVASQTGYSTEASFSVAFRQWAGVAPGVFRDQQRSKASE